MIKKKKRPEMKRGGWGPAKKPKRSNQSTPLEKKSSKGKKTASKKKGEK